MARPGSSFTPTHLGHEDNLEVRHRLRANTLQWRSYRFNFPHHEVGGAAVLEGLQEVYFSGSENVEDFIEGLDNQIKLLEIPSDLACAYLKGHLLGRARDWYKIFGSALVQNTDTDFAQLKAALTKNFPVVRNRKDLESQFYASQQNRDQDPTDFIYDQLKVHKKLGLSMPKEALVDHIFVRLEPQVQDYVEVRNPKTTAQLLEVLAKFEETYSCKNMQGSRNSGNVERRGWNKSRRSNQDVRQRNWRNSEVLHKPSNGRNNYRGNYESGRQRNQWFESRNELNRDDQKFDREYQSGNRVQYENFSRGNRRNRGSSTNFSRGNQRQGGRLNILKVRDGQNDQSQSIKEVPIKLSATCISPVELPYVLILLNETFTKALWDTGAEKSFISEDIYRKYLFYKQGKKSRAQVIMTQGATCRNVEKINGLPPDNPEVYRFAVDHRKLNAITKYPRYPLPLIDDLITNIPHTTIMLSLDLRSGYFQLAVNPSDIVKTAFVTKNGTYAFRRMPFGLSGTAPVFQKAIDIILKPVIGRFVNVYMENVIISSP
ncbi:uncharacterized protein TNIN_18101 [Trichonephila inaurata madagascariensis]|uniref:Reverse transcriptase domain-containing protein n=1 Tax=Trichonephila inaurata madagascariensis TaxID=2747483 RepID=A0A8X6X327_9ARAC|nr:uncharacterized protein TNIN_18101 [Trichonephila inaurata madagascariensis]